MRAPKNDAVGVSGETFVKGQFEELGWGAVANPQHDLGTDLWLMARDERRFDLGALTGAQVKSGESWFDEPFYDAEGELKGWWFREENENHFEYWCGHAVPHILVLHDPRTKASHWVHVTRQRVLSTGKGRKILVPAESLVNEANRDRLVEVAIAGAGKPADWEGSLWDVGDRIAASSRLRHALITPRLIAPHPNKGYDGHDPVEAIALLVQLRFRDLEGRRSGKKLVAIEEARHSPDWEWRLYAALHSRLRDGDRTGLMELLTSAKEVHQTAVAAVCAAVALAEEGNVVEARGCLLPLIDDDSLNPVDHAWLQAHLAHCELELGNLKRAIEISLDVQRVRQSTPSDPTSAAIAAAAGYTVFTLSTWDDKQLASTIAGSDTAANWWRSQTLATGLSRHFDETFERWTGNENPTYFTQDEAWTKLRSAMLQSAFAADYRAWGSAASLLARRQLMTAEDDKSPVWALDLLRVSGSDKLIERVVQRLLNRGPVGPLVDVSESLDLDASTRTSLHADLCFLRRAADVVTPQSADRHIRWLLRALEDPDALRQRLSPTFLVEHSLLNALAELVHTGTPAVRGLVMEHVIALPAQEDQLVAQGYGNVIGRIPVEAWRDEQLERLRTRPDSDNWELRDDIDRLLASRTPSYREQLVARVEAGDTAALWAFGNVTELPAGASAGMIRKLTEALKAQLAEEPGKVYLGGDDLLDTLVLMNAWHPEVADWTAVEMTLAQPGVATAKVAGGIQRLGQLANQVPITVRNELKPHLVRFRDQGPTDAVHHWLNRHDVQGQAALALAMLYPDELDTESLLKLVTGPASQRLAAAEILVSQREPDDLALLALLGNDSDPDVRLAVAEGLAQWVVLGASDETAQALQALISSGGSRLGIAASRALVGESASDIGLDNLRSMLVSHPSAVVRQRASRRP